MGCAGSFPPTWRTPCPCRSRRIAPRRPAALPARRVTAYRGCAMTPLVSASVSRPPGTDPSILRGPRRPRFAGPSLALPPFAVALRRRQAAGVDFGPLILMTRGSMPAGVDSGPAGAADRDRVEHPALQQPQGTPPPSMAISRALRQAMHIQICQQPQGPPFSGALPARPAPCCAFGLQGRGPRAALLWETSAGGAPCALCGASGAGRGVG